MVYLVKTPNAFKPFAADMLWSIDQTPNVVYLTFDDGPTKEITLQILDILDEYNAKATFFCIGGNIIANPDIYSEILMRGHRTGNHTWNHMNGWKYSDFSYLKNVLQCDEVMRTSLFRPPYGRIKRSQVKGLKHRFTIVMWDVLSGDWSADVSPKKCLQNVVKNARSGSIVVFHDSKKAEKNMLYALPRTLKELSEKGFVFEALPEMY